MEDRKDSPLRNPAALTPRFALQRALLETVGITAEEQLAALRKAFDEHRRQLGATKIELVTYQGDHQKVEVPDNSSRLRAIGQLYDLTGVALSRAEGTNGGTVTIEVILPDWAKPSPIVIEGQPSPESEQDQSGEGEPDLPMEAG
jgi:hypothetical protein